MSEYIKTLWDPILEVPLPLNVMLNALPSKGNLVYEYNPFKNYRLTSNKYWYKENYYSIEELNEEFKITLSEDLKSWIGVPDGEDTPILHEAGQLVDFVTKELSFSLEHPVNIIPQYSYDGSVNLIINDGINTPRLINSRFSATGKNTYEIVDRKGNTDTNIYDLGELFNIDTSLYKIVDKIPEIKFLKTSSGGNLKVGNYHFYFKLADADGNETDFIAESGLVSVFIGDGSYGSVHTGTKNENSTKLVEFGLKNIDSAYDYIIVYYSRSTAELDNNSITEYVKIDKKFRKTNNKLVITGFEDIISVTSNDINLHYNLVSSSHTAAVCLNMLFMGNVKKLDIAYEELLDLSLRILPTLKTEDYDPELTENYSSSNPKKSYINANYIYNKTGYWPGELYRFGIVYILPNGELTPVFNVRGAYNINGDKFTKIPVRVDENDKNSDRRYIKYNDNTYLLAEGDILDGQYSFENVKGVCSFNKINEGSSNNDIYYVNFKIPYEVKELLEKHVKGYFFVRLTRIPMKLALGITIGIDNESRTPTIPTQDGVLRDLENILEKTHVETEDIRGINYISEGFLKRYSFKFDKKSSSIWKSIGKVAGIAALVVGAVAATVVTMGGTAVVAGAAGAVVGSVGIAAESVVLSTTLATSILSTAIVTGASAVVAGATTAALASTLELGLLVTSSINANKKKLNGKATVAPSGYKLVETEDSRQLTNSFEDRIIIKDASKNSIQGIICPDYTVNQAYYNQIFTGNTHYIELDSWLSTALPYFINDYRHFYIKDYVLTKANLFTNCKVIAVPDSVTCVGIDNVLFRSKAGEAEEAWRYKCVGEEVTEVSEDSYLKINTDIVRGNFGPYLGFLNSSIGPAKTVNIYVPGYDPANILEYIEIRMSDSSPYYAITDRYSINDYESKLIGDNNKNQENIEKPAYRGDCYICQFTQRINRNFNDPSAPYNDEFVDINTWKDNYDPNNTEKYSEINLGDINAVPLGMWVTFQIRSSNNLNIRTLDGSNVDESAMTGNPRGYYPILPMSTEGIFKKPESHIYNKGFNKSVSERWNFELPDVPHIKNWFGTRIIYSDIHITDAYKNGFRVFQGTNYRDYTREYGEIVKLVPFESSLLCVFEHGVALIPVNERAVAGQGAGGNVYINTSNVLPENPKIISDMFGSQWPESILKVPGRTGDAPLYVYGVDTIAKKIWRTDGNTLECISDFKVQEFLNNNITLGERELTPKIGIRNVKTHYNAFKRDVMFTFYDNTYGFEEKVWNLCWNELLLKFITFYSWVPSYMENINNIPFSFDRNTSKWIARLGTSHSENSFADGITLSNNILNANPELYISTANKTDGTLIEREYYKIPNQLVSNFNYIYSYIDKLGDSVVKVIDLTTDLIDDEGNSVVLEKTNFIAALSLSNRNLPDNLLFYTIKYDLVRDSYGNYKKFKIELLGYYKLPSDSKFEEKLVPVYGLYYTGDNAVELCSELYYRNSLNKPYPDDSDPLIPDNKLMVYLPDKQLVYGSNITKELSIFTDDTRVGVYSTNGEFIPCNAAYDDEFYTIKNVRQELFSKNGEWYVHPKSATLLTRHYTLKSIDGIHFDKCIYKNKTGKRLVLPREQAINPDKIVTLLNIKASILIQNTGIPNVSDSYYNNKQAQYKEDTTLVDAGYYESTVAIIPKWNMQFLSTDFWKHGQTGIINIADEIFPTYWYGKQHPFEFEVTVVNDPSVHKIFDNIELVANKAKPESFHYEIVGDSYDFAKDKPNMYFRLEALKALWLYNGEDILYNRNFLNVQPKQLMKSADLIHRYYARLDTINEIEDYYYTKTLSNVYDTTDPNSSAYSYKHLAGAEVVYYPNRLEFRIWNHVPAVSMDDLLDTTNNWNKLEGISTYYTDNNGKVHRNLGDYTKANSYSGGRSIIGANCQYLEDKWKITINPIIVCYKNEFDKGKAKKEGTYLFNPSNTTWKDSISGGKLPPLAIYNSPIPDAIKTKGSLEFPDTSTEKGKDNALYGLYKNLYEAIDDSDWKKGGLDWLNDSNIYKYNLGEAQNRKEVDVRDKFIKIRIRYSGEELAVIDFLNTIYRISYA